MDVDLVNLVEKDRSSIAKRFLSPSSSAAEPPAPRARTEGTPVAIPIVGSVGHDGGGGGGGGGSGIGVDPVLVAINALTQSVNAMSLKVDTMASKEDMTTAIVEVVAPIQKGLQSVEKWAEKSEVRIAKLESIFETKTAGEFVFPPEIFDQIKAMQKEIELLRACSKDGKNMENQTEMEYRSKIAVFGGFKKFENFEAAKNWVYQKLWSEWLPTATDIYGKGDFDGILFCKFDNKEDRDKVVERFRKSAIKIENESIWSKPDAPLIARTTKSVVFAAKL